MSLNIDCILGFDVSKLYLGCFIDDEDRDIVGAHILLDTMMTTIRCLAACQGLGYEIAALQVTDQGKN